MSGKIAIPVKHNNNFKKPILIGIAGAVLLVGGFFGGAAYQKTQMPVKPRAFAKQAGSFSQRGFGGQRRAGNFGEVTAVSSTSITINNSRSGESKAYTVGTDTTVSNQGQTATIADIKTGDQVVITVSMTDANHAASIRLGGPAPMQN